jgi:ACS family tartrate transporter-like MFS transporter
VTADSDALTEGEQKTLAKVTRYWFIYIVIGQFFVQLDRTNIGFAKLTMSGDLGINEEAFGFASGIFALAAFFVQAPASMALERFGARQWLTCIMVAWGSVVMSLSQVDNAIQLSVMRFILGALEAGFVPGTYIIVSNWFRGNKHGRAISALQIGTATSGILGGPFAGWILGQSLLGLTGWRTLFLLEGALTVVWALSALLILHDGPAKTSWLKPSERKFMASYLAKYQAQKAASGAIEKAGFLDALKDPRIVLLMISYTFAGWVSATFAFFIPTLLKTAGSGLDNQTVGFLTMGPYIVMAIVAFTWGSHADRTERHWHCVIPLLVSAAGMLMFPVASKVPLLAMLCLALVQAGSTGFFVTFWPTCNMLVGKNTIAKTTAMINAGTHAASFVAPYFFGWTLDATGGNRLGLYVCAVMVLMNFMIMNIFFFRYKAEQRRSMTT